MGDAGEGLVDAEDRYQQLLAEREQERQRHGVATQDPEKMRKVQSIRLARAELERQQAVTESAIRQDQIKQALADLDRRLAEL